MKTLVLVMTALVLCACQSTQQAKSGAGPTPAPTPVLEQREDCTLVEETVQLRGRSVRLPAKGVFVEESHYATAEESFGSGRLFPRNQVEGIDAHLAASCAILKDTLPLPFDETCSSVYGKLGDKATWRRVWTPSEGGETGQAARGNLRPMALEEMYQGNMMFAAGALPKPGTKYLARVGSREVVIQLGYEIGPGNAKWLGGMTTEAFWYLGRPGDKQVEFGRLRDQSLPLGPIHCLEAHQ